MIDAQPVEILIVEDNPDDLEMTLHSLQHVNLVNRLAVARDGVEALDFVFCRGPHAGRSVAVQPRVVLLDLKLPKVDGLEVLKQIKSDPRTAIIPVVILTSSREQRDLVESYNLGVNSYVVKPVSFESFAAAVQELGLYWMLLNRSPTGKPPNS